MPAYELLCRIHIYHLPSAKLYLHEQSGETIAAPLYYFVSSVST